LDGKRTTKKEDRKNMEQSILIDNTASVSPNADATMLGLTHLLKSETLNSYKTSIHRHQTPPWPHCAIQPFMTKGDVIHKTGST